MTNGAFLTTELPIANNIHSDDRFLIIYNASGENGLPVTMTIPLNNVIFNSISFGSIMIMTGNGSPENVVSANVGSMYLRKDGGVLTTLYIKESGFEDTGWSAK